MSGYVPITNGNPIKNDCYVFYITPLVTLIDNTQLQSLAIDSVANRLGLALTRMGAGGLYRAARNGADLPLYINVDANTVQPFEGDEGGVIELVMTIKNCKTAEAHKWLYAHFGRQRDTKDNQSKGTSSELVVVNASSVIPEPIEWRWSDRLALGKVSLLVGNPGQGKSYATCAISAALTKGIALPAHNEDAVQGDVLMFAIEDGLSDTIRPRLDIVEADVCKVDVVTGRVEDGKEKHVSFETDLHDVERHIEGKNYKLIIIDPINAYLGGKLDTNSDSKLRSVLAPIAAMAERHNIAVLCVMHLNKSQNTNVLGRVMGSVGYVGLARTVLFLGEHPDNYQQRVIDCVKSNIGELPPPIAFELDGGKFYWVGETDARAEDILNAEQGGSEMNAIDEACEFLQEVLQEGVCKTVQVNKEAKQIGISETSLKRARKKLNIQSSRIGGVAGSGEWELSLPNTTTKTVEQLDLLSDDPVSETASNKEKNDISTSKTVNDDS